MSNVYDAGDDKDEEDDKKPKSDWPEIHKAALEEYDRDFAREQANIDEAYQDLKFRRGRIDDQWDKDALESRKGRPCHVVNKLPQFVRQVTGDMRQSRPAIKVIPVDSGADIETAEVRAGMIRYVENRSKAKHVYTTGADGQVTCGIGHWQVTTEYAHAGTFNQEIRIVGIEDGVAVLWDADAILPNKDDADHCFVPSDITLAKFKRQWPNAQASGFDTTILGGTSSSSFDSWSSDDYVRVVAYWKKKPFKRTLALMPDGSIEDLTDQIKDAPKAQVEQGLEFLRTQKGARIEERDSYKICRYLITLAEVLEEADWPGMLIPVVPVIGEEVRVGRDIYRHGIVRYARDLQKMQNFYASAESEVIALQPKAPFMGTKVMFQDNLDKWETANSTNHPFLPYTADPKAPGGKPERIPPPIASQAIQFGTQNTYAAMKEVIGIYDSSLGAKSNETSGVAIEQRDRQGDTGTFVYHDNFALAIERTGEIINELFPKIYDTQRTIRILGDDGQLSTVEINKPIIVKGVEKIQHDMSSGSYDVVMEQGPSYATKREYAQEGMTEFIRAFPPAAPLMGDLYAKAMDWPHAQEIGERLEEALPPAIKQKLQAERAERDKEAGKPPPEPTPQEQEQQQAEAQAKQQQQAMIGAELELKQAQAEEAKAKARKAIAEADKAEAEAKQTQVETADAHMDNLRKIEKHHQEVDHAQDKHEIDLTVKGFGEARAQQQAQHGAEKHEQTIKQMKQPAKEPA